jgi:hypothetical protein
MEQFPSNSRRDRPVAARTPAKAEPKKIEKIVTGNVSRQKRSLGKKFHETFIGEDARGVWNFVAFDVLIPAAKDMLSDAVSQGIERMLFGESRGPSRRRRGSSGGSTAGYINYNRYSSGPYRSDETRPPGMSRKARASHDFDEIVLDSRVDAEEVIDRMFDLINQYESATVSDLYELVGISGNFADEKWGWTNLAGAGVRRNRDGYLLDLPRPIPLD